MTSYDFLEMILDCGVNSKRAVGLATIRTQKDVKSLFGVKHDVEPGCYAWIRTDEISDFQFGLMEHAVNDVIMTDEMDTSHPEENVPIMYMVFKLEDAK